MNAPDCICSPGRLPLGAFCAGRDDLEREALHDDRISIRAPRVGCDFLRLQDIARALISIHAPRVGRDAVEINFSTYVELFQSTRPVWGATASHLTRRSSRRISIHAPRAGCDLDTEKPLVHVDDFNPRTPCGVRRWASRSSDLPRQYFNPRTPCGVRPCAAACRRRRGPDFNPRTPCGVRRWIRLLLPGTTNFNPRAPCGARLCVRHAGDPARRFQSTRPVWGATERRMIAAEQW